MRTMAAARVGFIPVESRLVLLAGFGGLLILMSFAGADGIQALQQIQTSNDRIRDDFLLRTRVLERIRGDLYLSGTDIRDYLLEPQAGKAEGHRYTLLENRRDMDAAVFFQAEDGIRDYKVTGVQTCALPISVEVTFTPLPAHVRTARLVAT